MIWIGTNTTDRQASKASFQAWLGKDPRLNNTGDDIWLYDSQTAIVDYIAYGTNNTTFQLEILTLLVFESLQLDKTTMERLLRYCS